MKLWEANHPYRCSETNYFASTHDGGPFRYESWAEFYEEFKDSDPDYNMVFRWDWKPKDPGEDREHDELYVYFMAQRKGRYWCNIVEVTPEDEPAVREWLAKKWAYLQKLWTPLSEP